MTVDPIGGVWTYSLELASALERHGIEIVLASMGTRLTRDQYQQVLARKNVRLFESTYRLEWMDDPWDDVDRAGDWLLQIAQRVRPNLIHLNGYTHAVLPWNAPVLVAAHSCVLSWWRAVKKQEAPAQYNKYRTRVACGLAAADSIVAPTAAMREALRVNYEGRCNCTVIPNGRDPRPFFCGEKTALVFSCGRIWDEAKNLRLLDQVAPHIQWPIALAGDCRHPTGSTLALQNLECAGKLALPELAKRLSCTAIFVLPAYYEPFGLSALEAGLSGCALVLGDIPSLREIWHGAAIFIPPGDQAALANALNSLIENSGRREVFGRRARARALDFSPHRMAKQYIAAYRACMRNELPSPDQKARLLVEEAA
jgi:glycosyltransferase involved in cell wall biosynthesis